MYYYEALKNDRLDRYRELKIKKNNGCTEDINELGGILRGGRKKMTWENICRRESNESIYIVHPRW